MWHAQYSHHLQTAVCHPHLHRFLDLLEVLSLDHMAEEDEKMDLGDVATLDMVEEVREGHHLMIAGRLEEFPLGSGEEAKHRRIETEGSVEAAAGVGEETEKAETGMIAAGDEDDGSLAQALLHAKSYRFLQRDMLDVHPGTEQDAVSDLRPDDDPVQEAKTHDTIRIARIVMHVVS